MRNGLGWPDGDNWDDFCHWLKEQLEIELLDEQWPSIETVGDLYDAIMLHVSHRPMGHKCATAMAFYRLRQGLCDLRNPMRVAPQTRLADVDPKALQEVFNGLGAEHRLDVPSARRGRLFRLVGGIAFYANILLVVLVIVALLPPHPVAIEQLFALAAVCATAIWLLTRFPDRAPEDCRTVGDLARRIAAYNYGRFVSQGARLTDDEVWDAVCEALAEFAAIPKSQITRETVFFDNQLKKKAA